MTTLKEEEPFAAAVKTVSLDTTCSYCFFNDGSDPAFRPPENFVHKCLGCHAVSYCDRKCQKSDWANHKKECGLLKLFTEKKKPIPEAEVRLIARILLKSDEQLAAKAFNDRTWDSLENHVRCGASEFRNKIDSIMAFLKPAKIVSREEVTKTFCKVATNKLDIIESRHGIGGIGFGIYLGLSIHKHSCLPDAQVIFNGTKASLRPFDEDAAYSTDLTICRFSVTPWSSNRKSELKKINFYECTCPLCTDDNHIVNRMGSSCHVSCCENAAGILDENSSGPYRCNNCGAVSSITVNDVKRAERKIDNQLMALGMGGYSGATGADVKKKILLEAEKILSVYNCHFMSICQIAITTGMVSSDYEMLNSLFDKNLKALEFYVPETERHRATSLLKRAMAQTMFGKAKKSDTDQAIQTAARCFGGGHPIVVEFKKFIFNYEMCCGMEGMDLSKFMGRASSSA